MQYNSLKNCIDVLEKVRDAHNSQLDTSVLAELDDVLEELKRLSDEPCGNVELGTLSLQVLQIIGHVISLVTNITDLMK
jgi:hypothetical protein